MQLVFHATQCRRFSIRGSSHSGQINHVRLLQHIINNRVLGESGMMRTGDLQGFPCLDPSASWQRVRPLGKIGHTKREAFHPHRLVPVVRGMASLALCPLQSPCALHDSGRLRLVKTMTAHRTLAPEGGTTHGQSPPFTHGTCNILAGYPIGVRLPSSTYVQHCVEPF